MFGACCESPLDCRVKPGNDEGEGVAVQCFIPPRKGRVANSASAEIAGWGEVSNALPPCCLSAMAPTPTPPRGVVGPPRKGEG